MTLSKRTIIFLALLVSLLLFLVGFRFGRYIERVNTTYVPPTPTPTLAPTIEPEPTQTNDSLLQIEPLITPAITPLQKGITNSIVHQGCGVSFTYPADLEPASVTKETALLQNSDQSRYISFTCTPETVTNQETTSETESSQGTAPYRGEFQPVTPVIGDIETIQIKPGIDTWVIVHPETNVRIRFENSEALTYIVSSSLAFK